MNATIVGDLSIIVCSLCIIFAILSVCTIALTLFATGDRVSGRVSEDCAETSNVHHTFIA
jgi:hypothetical protein